ncbi:MAG: methylenetetrahydrofolate reductase C-terminal domain-containing protein [Thermodesulfobacteriota bacterium]
MKTKCATPFARSLRNRKEFTLTFELVPSRGSRSKEQARILELARQIAADGRIRAVSITENAGGHPALSPEVLGIEIRRLGLDVIIHVSCKDKNRNQMESLLFAWDRAKLHNLLVITGDYPKAGYEGFPKPVFDLDSVQALDLMAQMNEGLAVSEAGRPARLPATAFVRGVAVSPFKMLEAELVPQYGKLLRKAAAGADYAITQVGFDARKLQEVLLFMRQHGVDLPILGNVFVPNPKVMELMARGAIPGCVIPDRLHRAMLAEAAAPDRGKEARLRRAAKLTAVLRGLGYDGVHIGGPGLTFPDLAFLLDEAERLAPRWRELVADLLFWPEEAFWYYERDPADGLNRPVQACRPRPGAPPLAFRAARLAHDLLFTGQGLLTAPMRRLCLGLAETRLAPWLARFEHVVKLLAFECQNCGDCTLAELAFLCPQSGCAKYILNGPCGGSRDGWCEVYPGRKRCLYVRVYERLKTIGQEGRLEAGFIPPRDWSLNNSSSWVSFFAGRDHAAKGRGGLTGKGRRDPPRPESP